MNTTELFNLTNDIDAIDKAALLKEEREDALEALVDEHLADCQSCTELSTPQRVAACIMDGEAWHELKEQYMFSARELIAECHFFQETGVVIAKFTL